MVARGRQRWNAGDFAGGGLLAQELVGELRGGHVHELGDAVDGLAAGHDGLLVLLVGHGDALGKHLEALGIPDR